MVTLSACDVAQLITDPAPHFEQTWNLPASSSTISVAELLPSDSSVRILPDSSGFSLRPSNVNLTEPLGTRCATCAAINGTTSIKPQFNFTTGSTKALATDVVSARILGGSASIQLTNNLTFDPLKVRASGTQGKLVILIHSGSLVLGQDSLDGASTTWAPGTQMTRTITLATGDALSGLTVDITLDSPQGDTPVFIDANRTIAVVASVPTLNAASIGLVVNNKTITSSETDLDLDGLDDGITNSVTRGGIEMTITNPFSITGNLDIRVEYGTLPADAVTKTVALPSGVAQVRSITLDRLDMDKVLGRKSAMTFGGVVTAATPITVGPRQKIDIDNRLQLTILTGGGQ